MLFETLCGRALALAIAETAAIVLLILWIGAGLGAFFAHGETFGDVEIFHASGRAFLGGTDPYFAVTHRTPGRNMNPPALIAALSPLALLSPPAAAITWMGISAGALLASLSLVRRHIAGTPSRLQLLLFLAFGGTMAQLVLGQIAWFLTLPATLGWLAYRRGAQRSAGAWWGVVIAVKPIFWPMLLLFVARRRWACAATAIVTGALVSFAGLLAVGPAAYRSWTAAGLSVDWFHFAHNASIYGLLYRLGLARDQAVALWALLGTAVLVVTWRSGHGADEPDADALCWVMAALLVAPLGWLYYLPLALGPLAAVLSTHPLSGRQALMTAGLFWPAGIMWRSTSEPLPWPPFDVLVSSAYGLGLAGLWGCIVWNRARRRVPLRQA